MRLMVDCSYFLFLEKKKVTKENSRQTQSLRVFCRANASLCGDLIIYFLIPDFVCAGLSRAKAHASLCNKKRPATSGPSLHKSVNSILL